MPSSESPSGSPSVGSRSRATFAFILVTVVLDTLAFGVMAPVLPKLLVTLRGGNVAGAATTLGVFGTAWAVMQFFSSPVLGSLSDRVGRRPVILLSQIGLGLDYVLMALAPNVWWLFVGRLLSGITGAGWTTASAYIADITVPEERAKRFGYIGAAWGFGFVVGPAFGGLLAGIDLRAPFWASAGLCLLNAAYGVFILPESLPKEKRTRFAWRNANFFGSLTLLRSVPALTAVAAAMFFYTLGHDVNPVIAVIYAQFRYSWSEQQVGLMLAVVGVCSMIVQALLVGPIVTRLGEPRAIAVGLGSGAAACVLFALADQGWLYVAGIPLAAFFGIAGPSMQGIATRAVSDTQQGQLQGAIGSITSLATMLAPMLFTQTFAIGVAATSYPWAAGLPYLVAAGCLLIAMTLALRSARQPAVAWP